MIVICYIRIIIFYPHLYNELQRVHPVRAAPGRRVQLLQVGEELGGERGAGEGGGQAPGRRRRRGAGGGGGGGLLGGAHGGSLGLALHLRQQRFPLLLLLLGDDLAHGAVSLLTDLEVFDYHLRTDVPGQR